MTNPPTSRAAIRLYIAGPMTGIEAFNYPAFNRVAALLRDAGYTVENPAENPERDSWQACMRMALAQVVRCDGVALLPGWMASRGARLEFLVASGIDMPTKPWEKWLA